MAAVALIIGHNARSQGAVRVRDGRTEYDWCGDLASAIRDCAPGMYRIIRRPAGMPYTREVAQAYAEADAIGAIATVELHFNSVVDARATGTETLSSGTRGSLRLANMLQPAMVGALGLHDRGVKILRRGDRGGESLWAGRAPAVMLEPYFGSNAGDCAAADRGYAALVAAIHDAALTFVRGGA